MIQDGSIIAARAIVNRIETTSLLVNQDKTSLKWSPTYKQNDIQLLNDTSTAKLLETQSGPKAILGNKSFVIGTSIDSLNYYINAGTSIRVGFAKNTRNLESLAGGSDLISAHYDVKSRSSMTLTLGLTTLTINYNGVNNIIDISGYAGSTMYPWLSDDVDGSGFSVDISKDSALRVYVREDGDIVFSSIDINGISRPMRFETGINTAIFDNLGFSGLPSINFDTLQSATIAPFTMTIKVQGASQVITIDENGLLTAGSLKGASVTSLGAPLILKTAGGSPVSIDDAGTITTPGTVIAADIIASSLTSSANLVLKENGGKGITIEDGSGAVTVDSTLQLGPTGINPSTVASFSSISNNKALILPTISSTGIISGGNLVTGMVAFSIADGKFMGYNGAAWVAFT